jgi:hypothetical protein
MLEFLTRQNHKPGNSLADTKLPPVNEVKPLNCSRQEMVKAFIEKNTFHGKSMMQYSIKCLSLLAKEREISQGAFFIPDKVDDKPVIKFLSAFASPDPENMTDIIELGEGFPGQVAKDGNMINISDIPEGYLTIESGLGKSAPASLIVFPVKYEDKIIAVIELASFHKFTTDDELYFSEISHSIAEQLHKCITRS